MEYYALIKNVIDIEYSTYAKKNNVPSDFGIFTILTK